MLKNIKKIAAHAVLVCLVGGFYTQSAHALLPIEHWSEPSGARIWLVHSPAIPMVDVQVDFDAGTRRDPATQAGLADAVALMSSKGVLAAGNAAPALDENALGEAWADLGASFGADAQRDGLAYSLRSLTEADLLQRATSLAARQLAAPSLDPQVWQRERARWQASIAESDTRPATVASKAFAKAVYQGHPYGAWPSAQSLEQIAVADMQRFQARYLQACRARVSIVGALSRQQAQAVVGQLLAGLPGQRPGDCQALEAVPEVAPLTQAEELRIPFASAQAHILVGQPGYKRSDPDFLALLVGNHILGGGAFTSRLTNEVREQRGLSYSVGSSFSPGLNAGAFVISLQTRPDQAEQALQVTRQVLQRFVKDGPTAEELRAAKDNLIGGFALRIDSNRKLLGNVVNIAWNDLPLDYLEHWTARVQALTVADIRAAMQRKLQPERMVTVVVGGQK